MHTACLHFARCSDGLDYFGPPRIVRYSLILTKSATVQVFAHTRIRTADFAKFGLRVRERFRPVAAMRSQAVSTHWLVALLPVAMAGIETCVRPAGEWTGFDQVPT